MANLPEAQKRIMTALADMPPGYSQRIDGLRCEKHVIDLTDLSFWWALRRTVAKGWVQKTFHPQFWPSCRGMPNLALTPAGRSVLASTGDHV